MMRLEILEGAKGTPELDNLSLLIVPDVVESEISREPIELLPTVADKFVHVILRIFRDVELTVMRVRGIVRSHGSSYSFYELLF
jgi:hypothetical protein|tara:strand:+ start:1436 stop:1687 length:252 start_codon:yes stop_codon:yes gene_type:complete